MGSPRLMLAIAFTLTGCTKDDDKDGPADTDAQDTDSPTVPDYGEPTRLDLTCAPTSNELRFECTVQVDPAQPVELTFVRADGLSTTRTVAGADAVAEHLLPLYFMAPSKDYTVTVKATAWPDHVATTTVTTSAVPPDVASSIATDFGAPTAPMVGLGHPCMPPDDTEGFWDDAIAVVYDTQTGDLLWYQNMDEGGSFGPNDMVLFTDEHTIAGESLGDIVEVDLMGRDLVRLNGLAETMGATATGVFGNFHHDIAKHGDVFYVMYEQEYGDTTDQRRDVLDNLILFDGTGTELARWYAEDHLDIPPDWSGIFTSMNGIDVDPAGDIILSIKGEDTVGKVKGDWTSPDFGEVIWLMDGNGVNAIGSTITVDWTQVGPPAVFSFEHSVYVRPNDGQLLLLDNDHGRGLRFDIDEAAGTATANAEYPTNIPACGPQGTARSTEAGNVLVGCSGGRFGTPEPNYVREYDNVTAELVWEAHTVCPNGGNHNATRWYPLEGW